MIEILFGESEAASMKAAKCEQIYVSSNDGPTACFGAGKRKVPEKKDYSWIEGNSTEVVCLGFLEIFKKRLLEVIARICFYRFTIKISGMARTITNQNYRKCLNITHRIYHVCRNIWKIVKQFVSGTVMRRIPDVDFIRSVSYC